MILITGQKGFIGRHICAYFDKNGIEYVGYDLVDGNDIRDKSKLESFFSKGITTVIHLAALAGVRKGEEMKEEYLTTNVNGTFNVLSLAEKYKVRKCIVFSSSSVLGENGTPISFYGMTKAVVELMSKRFSIPVTVVRPFTVYGENGRKDQVVYKWIDQINNGQPISFFGDGTSSRGYTYVGDIVQGIMKILSHEPIAGIFNFGGVEKVSLIRLLSIFTEVKGNIDIERLPMPYADIKESLADISETKKVFGWEPVQDFTSKIKQILYENLRA